MNSENKINESNDETVSPKPYIGSRSHARVYAGDENKQAKMEGGNTHKKN